MILTSWYSFFSTCNSFSYMFTIPYLNTWGQTIWCMCHVFCYHLQQGLGQHSISKCFANLAEKM